MDTLTFTDFVSSHGFGDPTQEAIQQGQQLISAGDDYATAAAEVVFRGLTLDNAEHTDPQAH